MEKQHTIKNIYKKNYLLIIYIFFFIFVALLFTAIKSKLDSNNYVEENLITINGEVTNIKERDSKFIISLLNNKKKFTIDSPNLELIDYNSFEDTVKVEDIIEIKVLKNKYNSKNNVEIMSLMHNEVYMYDSIESFEIYHNYYFKDQILFCYFLLICLIIIIYAIIIHYKIPSKFLVSETIYDETMYVKKYFKKNVSRTAKCLIIIFCCFQIYATAQVFLSDNLVINVGALIVGLLLTLLFPMIYKINHSRNIANYLKTTFNYNDKIELDDEFIVLDILGISYFRFTNKEIIMNKCLDFFKDESEDLFEDENDYETEELRINYSNINLYAEAIYSYNSNPMQIFLVIEIYNRNELKEMKNYFGYEMIGIGGDFHFILPLDSMLFGYLKYYEIEVANLNSLVKNRKKLIKENSTFCKAIHVL